ncbi:glycosyltransferase family 4 protein [bacterium]|nr:glycosyltransferase family 4 protein [bacterium]
MAKKILLIANTDWYLFNFRLDLVKDIYSRGYEPILVSPPGKYVKDFTQLGFKHISWAVGRKSIAPWKEISSISHLKKIYEQEKPVLVHHHTNKAVLYGSIAARQLDIPVINSIPGRGYVYSSNDLLAKMLRFILQLLFRTTLGTLDKQQMIFENQEDMNYFIHQKFISQDKANLIPSVGVNISKYASSNPPTDRFIVAFVGRLLPDKGVGIFVDAAKILSKRKNRSKMVLIGLPDPNNPNSYTTDQINAWHNDGLIEWWGWQEDMRKAYQKINVLANPTYYGEGVPTTLLEAGANKRAVIATDWPGCREIIIDHETGLLIPPKDPVSLADSIEFLETHPAEYERLRINLFEKTTQEFSTKVINSKTLSIYDRFLNF